MKTRLDYNRTLIYNLKQVSAEGKRCAGANESFHLNLREKVYEGKPGWRVYLWISGRRSLLYPLWVTGTKIRIVVIGSPRFGQLIFLRESQHLRHRVCLSYVVGCFLFQHYWYTNLIRYWCLWCRGLKIAVIFF